jgi:hypothetical protein
MLTSAPVKHYNNPASQTLYSYMLVLLRLLNNSLGYRFDIDHGKAISNAGLLAARQISIQQGDLASRLATGRQQ